MSKIQITPKYSEVKPAGCYVYLHRKASTGDIFYVGKGQGRRGWDSGIADRPNSKWRNFAAKHGVTIEIAQCGMSEEDAFLLEMWLIAKFRYEGIDLCNMTDGGEGNSGREWTQDQRDAASSPVWCSNGMFFKSQTAAIEWLRSIGITKAHKEGISACCRGMKRSGYGFAWWFDGDAPKEYVSRGKRISDYRKIPICCSNGMWFDSTMSAVEWLATQGIIAAHGNIGNACRGKLHMAYGYAWWYDGDDPKPEKQKGWHMVGKRNRPIMRGDGETYEAVYLAVAALKAEGFDKARQGNISSCARGERQKAYGYTWRYL